MALRDWLSSGAVATATIATTATKQAQKPRSVASVARIAVADPGKSEPEAPAGVDLRDRPGFFLENGEPDLPECCPLKSENTHPEALTKPPKGCRFHPRLFRRLMTEGTLPMPDGTCPMRRVCNADPERGPHVS